MTPDFIKYPKMARFSRDCVVTEKIDGTNAQIMIEPIAREAVVGNDFVLATKEMSDPESPGGVNPSYVLAMYAGSRSRFLTRKTDNFGFVVVHGVRRQSGRPSVVLEPKGLDPKIEVIRETPKELRFIDRRPLKYSGPDYEPRPQKQKKFMCIGGLAGGQTLARVQAESYGRYYAFNFAGNNWPIMKFGSRRHNQVYIHESLL